MPARHPAASERGRKRLKFGIMPAYQIAPVETAAYTAGFAQLAEALGFESVWPVEHVVMPARYASRYPYDPGGRMPIPDAAIPDPLIWNTWAAAATRKLRVGTSILILPQHNPVVLAKALASLDVLSGGRVILGIGVGWMSEEFELLGRSLRAAAVEPTKRSRFCGVCGPASRSSTAGDASRFRRRRCPRRRAPRFRSTAAGCPSRRFDGRRGCSTAGSPSSTRATRSAR